MKKDALIAILALIIVIIGIVFFVNKGNKIIINTDAGVDINNSVRQPPALPN